MEILAQQDLMKGSSYFKLEKQIIKGSNTTFQKKGGNLNHGSFYRGCNGTGYQTDKSDV